MSSSRAALSNKRSVKVDCTGAESAVLTNERPGQEKTPQLLSQTPAARTHAVRAVGAAVRWSVCARYQIRNK